MSDELHGWIKVEDHLPEHKPGIESEPVLVMAQEFGQKLTVAVCRFWQSSMEGQPVKLYLDMDFYGLERTWEIGAEVVCWKPIFPLPEFCLNFSLQRCLFE